MGAVRHSLGSATEAVANPLDDGTVSPFRLVGVIAPPARGTPRMPWVS